MAKNPVDELKKGYDEILDKLLKRLKDLLYSMAKEREGVRATIKEELQSMHNAKTQEFENQKAEFYQSVAEIEEKRAQGGFKMSAEEIVTERFSKISFKNKDKRIKELEKELAILLEEEVNISEQESTTLKNEETLLEKDIQRLRAIIEFIEKTVGSRKKYEFKIFGKGRNTIILTRLQLEELYKRIVAIYTDLEKRWQAEKWQKERLEPMKKRVEERANSIITQLQAVLAGPAPS